MRRTLFALVSIVVAVGIFFAASAAARPVAHVQQEAASKVVRYWTPGRMMDAAPASVRSPAAKPSKEGGGSTPSGTSNA